MSTPLSQDMLSPSPATATSHSPPHQHCLVSTAHCHSCVLSPGAHVLMRHLHHLEGGRSDQAPPEFLTQVAWGGRAENLPLQEVLR